MVRMIRGAALSLDTFDTLCSIWPASEAEAYVDLQQPACREKFTGPVESFNIACTVLTGSRQYFLFVVAREGPPGSRMRIIDYQLTSLHAFSRFLPWQDCFYKPAPGLHV